MDRDHRAGWAVNVSEQQQSGVPALDRRNVATVDRGFAHPELVACPASSAKPLDDATTGASISRHADHAARGAEVLGSVSGRQGVTAILTAVARN